MFPAIRNPQHIKTASAKITFSTYSWDEESLDIWDRLSYNRTFRELLPKQILYKNIGPPLLESHFLHNYVDGETIKSEDRLSYNHTFCMLVTCCCHENTDKTYMREAFSLFAALQIRVKSDMREAFPVSNHWNLQVTHSTSIKSTAGFFLPYSRPARNHRWPSNCFSRQ